MLLRSLGLWSEVTISHKHDITLQKTSTHLMSTYTTLWSIGCQLWLEYDRGELDVTLLAYYDKLLYIYNFDFAHHNLKLLYQRLLS